MVLLSAAHGQIVFEEYFDNGMPESFVLENLDGLVPDDPGLATMADSAWTVRFISSQGFGGGSGSNAAFSVSWYVGDEGPSNDWMILPGVELGNEPFLSWTAMAITSSGTFRDRYQVFVSTAGQEIENFFLESPIFDTGEQGEATTETAHEVSLSQFANQTVYIAFRNFTQPYDSSLPGGNGNGGNELAVDNIVVSEGPLSIAETDFEGLKIRTWPQPAIEQFRIELPVAASQLRWVAYDLYGRMVDASEGLTTQAAFAPILIDVSAWNAGKYIVQLEVDGQRISTPVLVVR